MYKKANLQFGQDSSGAYVIFTQMPDESFVRTFRGTYEGMMMQLEADLRVLLMSTPNILHSITIYAPPELPSRPATLAEVEVDRATT